MTQEEKQLLLVDLCARLPYNVCVHIRYKTGEPCYGKLTLKDIQWFIDSKIENIKPYLRPMSSMTEEEENIVYNGHIQFWNREDYCNKHHLDFRGLIPIGLALEAPDGIYNF